MPTALADDPLDLGIEGPLEPWLRFNTISASQGGEKDLARIAPFAPIALIRGTTGLERIDHFAMHGADIVRALAATTGKAAALVPVAARFWRRRRTARADVQGIHRPLRGCRHRPSHRRTVGWVRANLPWVEAVLTAPGLPLPFPDDHFDMIVSMSVFSHINEADQAFYLSELHRVAEPGAHIVITVHGERGLERAMKDVAILKILGVDQSDLDRTQPPFRAAPASISSENLGTWLPTTMNTV